MRLSEQAEEVLEKLWMCTVESDQDWIELSEIALDREAAQIRELLDLDHVTLDGSRITLTQNGQNGARKVVRRHRLAERLLTDVLNAKEACVHTSACEFEHILHHGIDENVCTLLGHPRFCPHGKPIPEGECCRKARTDTQRVVAPLSSMKAKQKGRIAYLEMQDLEKLHTFMAMGLLPGISIKLVQTSPSYIFQADETRFTVDRDMADSIFVRLVNE